MTHSSKNKPYQVVKRGCEHEKHEFWFATADKAFAAKDQLMQLYARHGVDPYEASGFYVSGPDGEIRDQRA